MPDARLARTRATLPAGYQFGDAVDATLLRMLAIFGPRRDFALIAAISTEIQVLAAQRGLFE